MESVTISRVSRELGISTRMLRYYEQQGLIRSFRREGYAYRVYDEETLHRLRQIQILRKLRIPVKQVKVILDSPEAAAAIDIFRRNISELDGEIAALSTIRGILNRFLKELEERTELRLHSLLTGNDEVLDAVDSLSLISINFREDQKMEELNEVTEQLGKLTDVRIVYLPPATVAAAHFIGDEPEDAVHQMIEKFVRESGLLERKPDLRQFGFNHPNPVDETNAHGYEDWVTIPDDMEVPAPLEKKRFPGGLYAAHMITMGNFHEWDWLIKWGMENDKYEFAGDFSDQEHMCGLLEEGISYGYYLNRGGAMGDQLDLLMPIREKE